MATSIITKELAVITKQNNSDQKRETRGQELKALGFIIVVLFPMLTIAGIGAYGFVIWMIQAFGGSVGH
ncbi:MAG: trimethylamine N-oxide reductase system protein TorE [Gammaproteobacteria bacterium]|nr:trimethylamine N-oxide reductase system protein TorE [Gammaproteobacteria bacterium]